MGNATAAGMGRQAGVRARAHAGTGIACVDAGTMPGAACRQMPLSFLGSGETATIAKVRGKGDLIVEVKGTQVALNKQIASRVITNAVA